MELENKKKKHLPINKGVKTKVKEERKKEGKKGIKFFF
jgi:hypothetical protein